MIFRGREDRKVTSKSFTRLAGSIEEFQFGGFLSDLFCGNWGGFELLERYGFCPFLVDYHLTVWRLTVSVSLFTYLMFLVPLERWCEALADCRKSPTPSLILQVKGR